MKMNHVVASTLCSADDRGGNDRKPIPLRILPHVLSLNTAAIRDVALIFTEFCELSPHVNQPPIMFDLS